MGSCAYPIDHREVWSETGSVLSRIAPRDILGDAITSFIGYYKVSKRNWVTIGPQSNPIIHGTFRPARNSLLQRKNKTHARSVKRGRWRKKMGESCPLSPQSARFTRHVLLHDCTMYYLVAWKRIASKEE